MKKRNEMICSQEDFSPDAMNEVEVLAKKLEQIPQDKRVLVTMSALSFISGLEAAEAQKNGAGEKSA